MWQLLVAAARNANATETRPAICAALFLEAQEALRIDHDDLRGLSVHWHGFPSRKGKDVGLLPFLHQSLQACQATQTAAASPPLLVIDSLDTALAYHGRLATCSALQSLLSQQQASSILACVHGDVHSAATIAALRQLASCTLSLQPASATQAEAVQAACGHTVHVEASALTLRHSGAPPTFCKLAHAWSAMQLKLRARDQLCMYVHIM